jgi:two-component system, cell cycle sensor histidine kinase and response regulator CckA
MRLLYFETSASEAEEVRDALACHGFAEPCVTSRLADFEASLGKESWTAVLAEFRDSQWRGHPALHLARKHLPNIPFVFLSSATGGELAGTCIGAGATDYVLKSRLWRLPIALRSAIDSAESRAALSQVKALLLASEAEELAILRTTTDGVIMMGTDGKIRMANPAAERIFGYESGALLGMPVSELMPEPARSKHGGCGTKDPGVKAPMIRGNGGETVGRRKSGGTFPVEFAASEVDISGRKYFTRVVRDISARKELEAELVHAQKMEATGRMAAAVAHEINNVMTIVSGQSQLLLGMGSLPEEVGEGLKTIDQALERAQDLVARLLVFSRRNPFNPRTFDLNANIRKSEEMLRLLLGKQSKLVMELERDLLPVFADPAQMDQVLVNLVVNARDAMPNGGTLTIRTRRNGRPAGTDPQAAKPEQSIGLIVSDTGTGISPEVKSKIFDPFFTTKPAGQGTGLGLSTVHGIVSRCKGRIEVDTALGKGTNFHLVFPQAELAAVE